MRRPKGFSRTGGIATYASYGLIDHVDISKSALTSDCSLHAIDGNGAGEREWNEPIPWGTDNLIVVEASRFDYCAGSLSDGIFDGYSGVKYLARFNEFLCSNVGSHGFDSGGTGTVFMEFYGNKWSNPKDKLVFEAIGYRSGTGAVHDNFVVHDVTASARNFVSFAQLRMYRPSAPFFGPPPGGRGVADGNLERVCDTSGTRQVLNVCRNDDDCCQPLPNGTCVPHVYGRCGASLCRRLNDGATPLSDSNNAPMICTSDAECLVYVNSNRLPPGSYRCDGAVDGDRTPHPRGMSAGVATGMGALTLSIPGVPWRTDEWRWFVVYNDTDRSRCLVTRNTNNTLFCGGLEFVATKTDAQALSGTIRGARSGAQATVFSKEFVPGIYAQTGYPSLVRVELSSVTGSFQIDEELLVGCPSACRGIGRTLTGSGLFGGSSNTWRAGDRFHLSIGWPMRQGAGVGRYGSTPDPIYAWNNSFQGVVGGHVRLGYDNFAGRKLFEENRDYFNSAKPGHVDLPCPDLRTGLSGVCNVSQPGNIGYPGQRIPVRPVNLRVQ